MTARIEIAGLTIGSRLARKDAAAIISDVDLGLEAGGTLGIAGESGSGKSTLLLAMMGAAKGTLIPLAGHAQFDDVDLFAAPASTLAKIRGRRIALVPQNAATALTPTLRVGAQLDEALRLHSMLDENARRDRIVAMFERVRLPDPATIGRRFPHELSGGQLQRVAIAMALVAEPVALLLDEPTTGLDATTQRAILELLGELQRERGLTMVCVSHDLGVLAHLCRDIAVMYAGRVVEVNKSDAILSAPAHPYTRALVAAQPRLSVRAIPPALPGRPPPPGSGRTGCSFLPRCTRAQDRCRTERPSQGAGSGSLVACHFPTQGPIEAPAPVASSEVGGSKEQEPILLVDALEVAYRRRSGIDRLLGRDLPPAIVQNVGFILRRGEILGLVGESGSGKSTILRTLAGLWPSRGGRLLLDNTHDLRTPARRRAREALRMMQLVFQNPDASLNPRHTVREILAQPLRLYFRASGADIAARATAALQDVRLDASYLDRYPTQLSGGERQRIAIARAFAAEPQVILCDEVTSALDVSVQASVLKLIQDLVREKAAACLFVSHDLAVVQALADRVMVMKAGEIVEAGDAAQVIRAPKHAYTRALIEAALP